MAGVCLDNVRKVFDNGHVAVDNASFEVADGELLVLVGPSGCGKTTMLRMIAGLEQLSSGTVSIGTRTVNAVAPKDRDIAMVFQNYALYPHMSVAENLAFGLKLRGQPRAQVKRSVLQAARMLGLESVLDRAPRQLSGGQRQRVALGRALVREPSVFLLDEPLSNLDARLRLSMRVEIARLHRRLGTTMIYVTHDQIEAMTLGQRIVVLDDGHIQQIDTPMALYERPANLFVASFLGSPAMNVLRGRIASRPTPRLHLGDAHIDLSHVPGVTDHDGELLIGIRPEDLHLERDGAAPHTAHLTAHLDVIEPVGNEVFLNLHVGTAEVVCRAAPYDLPEHGSTVRLRIDTQKLHAFDPETGRRVSLRGALPRLGGVLVNFRPATSRA